MVETIHIHEDDWGMRNLYPLAAAAEAAAELEKAQAAGERNRAPDGLGWTQMHFIEAPSITYVDRGLRLGDAAAALEAVMPRVRGFNATIMAGFEPGKRDPYGSYETEAWCFGISPACFIKLEPTGELVRDIWFEIPGEDEAAAATIREAIERVNALEPSYIVDYWLDMAGPADDEFLDNYFAVSKAHAEEVRIEFERMRREGR